MTEFACGNCGRVLCQRYGNTIIAYGFTVEIDRSRSILCGTCGAETPFYVNRQADVVPSHRKNA